jgi:hypothetical protein
MLSPIFRRQACLPVFVSFLLFVGIDSIRIRAEEEEWQPPTFSSTVRFFFFVFFLARRHVSLVVLTIECCLIISHSTFNAHRSPYHTSHSRPPCRSRHRRPVRPRSFPFSHCLGLIPPLLSSCPAASGPRRAAARSARSARNCIFV